MVDGLVAHEVERPLRNLRRDPVAPRKLAALLSPHLQALGTVEPPSALAVHDQALPREHRMQPRIAVSTVLRGEDSQALEHRRVVAADELILPDRPRHADDPAAPPLAQPHLRHQETHGFALHHGHHQFLAGSSFIAVMSSI
jgi:hypothetical protein